jgi:hypothetical protein
MHYCCYKRPLFGHYLISSKAAIKEDLNLVTVMFKGINHPYCYMTELVAPHRETAQAPLCRFGRGLRVRSQSLSVCGKIACQEETRDTDDLYRFGPLRSVIPYSCVLVDLCMNELQVSADFSPVLSS